MEQLGIVTHIGIKHPYYFWKIHLTQNLICLLIPEQQIRGLIYKTLQRIHAKSVPAPKSRKCCVPKNVEICRTWRTSNNVLYTFINSKSTCKFVRFDPPHILLSPHPYSTINGQRKLPHEWWHMEMSCWSMVLVVNHGERWREIQT